MQSRHEKNNIISLTDYYNTWRYVIDHLDGTIKDMALLHQKSEEYCMKVMLLAVRTYKRKA